MKNQHNRPSFSSCYSGFSRSMFWRRPHQRYGHQYHRRASSSNINTTSSLCKTVAPLFEERLSFKLNSHHKSESRYHEVSRGNVFWRPERIRSNALFIDTVSSDVAKMVCGICLKLLTWKVSSSLSNTMSTSELSVVAILACGHAYHVECLEERTSDADRQDPPCPICADTLFKLNASKE